MRKEAIEILVVEDHSGVRSILGKFLECLGHSVSLAQDADSALQRMVERQFDVLVTDVALPDRDGWQLVEELRQLGYLPPLVISMSAHRTGTELGRSKAAGCQAHLNKPFLADRLEELLKTATKRPPSKIIALPMQPPLAA